MNAGILIDGRRRLRKCPEFKARLQELRAAIQAKYAAELAEAGILSRFFLRQRIAAEYRRERRKLYPSAQSLYCEQ